MTTVRAIAALSAREARLIAAARGEEMTEPDQVRALLDATRVLEEARCPYALIGGIAVGVHSGVPRATQDVDLAIPTFADRAAVGAALAAAGFRLTGEFAHSLNFRHPKASSIRVVDELPNHVVELLRLQRGLVFEPVPRPTDEQLIAHGYVTFEPGTNNEIANLVDHLIPIPDTLEILTPILATVPLQLLAYHVAVMRGCNVDMPRNLAKSVTVE